MVKIVSERKRSHSATIPYYRHFESSFGEEAFEAGVQGVYVASPWVVAIRHRRSRQAAPRMNVPLSKAVLVNPLGT